MDYIRAFYMGNKFSWNKFNKAHGGRFVFEMDDGDELLEEYHAEGLALNVHRDGTVMLTGNRYDSRAECFVEHEVHIFEGEEKKKMIKKSDDMLEEHPAASGDGLYIPGFGKLMEVLKGLA